MKVFKVIAALIVTSLPGAILAEASVSTSYGDTTDQFLIEGIGLGSTESNLLRIMGEPISKTELEPVFGEREAEFRFSGLVVLTIDGVVDSMRLASSPYSLDNGITIGMTRSQVEQELDQSFELEDVRLRINSSDCHAALDFDENVLQEVWVFCEM